MLSPMDPKRHLVILNPAAGKGKAAERTLELEKDLRARGLHCEIHLTTAPGDAIAMARQAGAEGFGVVVAAGGDGTVNEVVNGLARAVLETGAAPVLGVLPVGRGNDFCHGAGLPGDLEAASAALAAGGSRPLDLGRVTGGDYPEGRFFGNGIGVGFDTIVGLKAAEMGWAKGAAAYVFGALATILAFPKPPEVRVTWGEESYEGRSSQISILNGCRMGGTFYMAPGGRVDDGLLDLCLAGPLDRRDMVKLLGLYAKGSQASHPKIRMDRAAAFLIEAPEGGLVCHADGETICVDGSSLKVECFPAMLSLVGPPLA
jgi:YegS/Rv2252/BmrU family lipid kinase